MCVYLRPINYHRHLIVSALLILVGLAAPALGQIGDGTGLAEALNPEYFNRDIVTFADELELDDIQRVIVEALFEDYLYGFEEAKSLMSSRFESMGDELQSMDKGSVVKAALRPLRDLIDTKDTLREQLFTSVQTVLTNEQMLKWPSFLRRMTRVKTLSKGRLSGESIDLFYVLRDMRLPSSLINTIQPVLLDYEINLDYALNARNASFVLAQQTLLDSIADLNKGTDTRVAERQIKLRVAIRDVNNQSRELIADALQEKAGDIFHRLALERAYPTIFRRSMLQKLLSAALDLEDLEEDKLQEIRDFSQEYMTELVELNSVMLQDLLVSEPREMLDKIEAFKARSRGQKPTRTTSRSRNAQFRINELSTPFITRLQDLLTQEQFASLPQAQRIIERQRRLDRLRIMETINQKEETPARSKKDS